MSANFDVRLPNLHVAYVQETVQAIQINVRKQVYSDLMTVNAGATQTAVVIVCETLSVR